LVSRAPAGQLWRDVPLALRVDGIGAQPVMVGDGAGRSSQGSDALTEICILIGITK
jgi:hypothetical protein